MEGVGVSVILMEGVGVSVTLTLMEGVGVTLMEGEGVGVGEGVGTSAYTSGSSSGGGVIPLVRRGRRIVVWPSPCCTIAPRKPGCTVRSKGVDHAVGFIHFR